MTVLDKIKELAKRKGLSLVELNDKAGLGKNVIYSWKHKTPTIENIKKVADVLDVSTDYILGKESNKHSVDLDDDDVIFTYKGRQIPKEDLETIKRFMRGK